MCECPNFECFQSGGAWERGYQFNGSGILVVIVEILTPHPTPHTYTQADVTVYSLIFPFFLYHDTWGNASTGVPSRRKCPGYQFAYFEVSVLTAILLNRFILEPVEGQKVEKFHGLLTEPNEEIYIYIRPREAEWKRESVNLFSALANRETTDFFMDASVNRHFCVLWVI